MAVELSVADNDLFLGLFANDNVSVDGASVLTEEDLDQEHMELSLRCDSDASEVVISVRVICSIDSDSRSFWADVTLDVSEEGVDEELIPISIYVEGGE